MEMQGTDMDSLRHHVGIQPLFVIFGGAMILISAFVSACQLQLIVWMMTMSG